MVIFGGLEILAAGYVLNEINKDDKKAKSESRPHRRKHEHRHSPSRPSRPQTQTQMQSLMPPQHGPGRPSSAPPPMMRPPFQGGPQMPPMPGRPPPQTQSWPVQARPPTQAEAAQYYNQNHGRPALPPHVANPSAYPGPPPAPGPGHMQHNPTMHFDTKTGKWQSNMLPPDMQPGGTGGKRSLSDIGLDNDGHRNMSTSQLIQPAPHPLAREDSYSSVSSTSSTDEDLAYGKVYEKTRPPPRRVLSHDRERPHELANTSRLMAAPVELDWYATQSQKKPAMAQVAQTLMNREGRASTLPIPTQQYSVSQPNLAVYEMDGTGVGGDRRAASPRPQHVTMELDSRDTERYRAFQRADSHRSGDYRAYRPG